MSHLSKRTTYLPIVLVLLALAIVAGGCTSSPAAAQAPQPVAGQRSVTVTGQGKVSARPDLAMVNLGVETIADMVADASKQNNEKMAAIMAKLKELGIAEQDTQTSNFSINSERYSAKGDMTETAIRYRVSNMVQIRVRDLGKVGPVLDAVVQAGANQVWGVNFTIEDQTTLAEQARSKAVEDARQRAEALAKLTNVQLGQVLTVSEGGTVNVLPMAALAMGKGDGGGTEVSPGEMQVSYQVQVTYEIK